MEQNSGRWYIFLWGAANQAMTTAWSYVHSFKITRDYALHLEKGWNDTKIPIDVNSKEEYGKAVNSFSQFKSFKRFDV